MWITSFRKEMEKMSGVPWGAVTTGALNAMDINSSSKEKMNEVKMTPLRQQAQALQLPGSGAMGFEGSKRIDVTANETTDKF